MAIEIIQPQSPQITTVSDTANGVGVFAFAHHGRIMPKLVNANKENVDIIGGWKK